MTADRDVRDAVPRHRGLHHDHPEERPPPHAAGDARARRRGAHAPPRARAGPMNISGEITVAAPRDAVFDKLKDAPFFASCIEGVKDPPGDRRDALRWTAKAKVAYMTFKFEVTGRGHQPDAARHHRGQGRRHAAQWSADRHGTHAASGSPDQTVIAYSIDSTLAGKLGVSASGAARQGKDMERGYRTTAPCSRPGRRHDTLRAGRADVDQGGARPARLAAIPRCGHSAAVPP